MKTCIQRLIFTLALATSLQQAAALDTAFTYQGRLNDGGNPANGNYDLKFSLFDAMSAGNQTGDSVTNASVAVSSGLFIVSLDFGANFPGAGRWLEIEVRSNAAAVGFTALTPRQPLTPSPYAITAGSVSGISVQPNTNGAPNFIGGASFNYVGPGTVGVVIGGGGAANYSGSAGSNSVSSDFGVIGGGNNNYILQGIYSTIGGGLGNSVLGNSSGSTISGGTYNQINPVSFYSTIAGGFNNELAPISYYSVIGGGVANYVTAPFATVSGGEHNSAFGDHAFVGGGLYNSASIYGTVSGGESNVASGQFAAIPGGIGNVANGSNSFAAGNSAIANHNGSFVWSDSSGGTFASTGSNQFLIRAAGGVGIGTNNPQAALHVNGTVRANSFSGSGAGLTGMGAASLLPGSISNSLLANNAITASKMAVGQVVKSLNGLNDTVTLSAGANMTLTSIGNTLWLAATGGISSFSSNGLALPYTGTASSSSPLLTLYNSGSGAALNIAANADPAYLNGALQVDGGSSNRAIYASDITGTAIYGWTTSGEGVSGHSELGFGLHGFSSAGTAVYAETDTGAAGIFLGSVGIGTSNLQSLLTVSGTVTADAFTGSGTGLVNLPAGNLSGTIPDALLSTNVLRWEGTNIISHSPFTWRVDCGVFGGDRPFWTYSSSNSCGTYFAFARGGAEKWDVGETSSDDFFIRSPDDGAERLLLPKANQNVLLASGGGRVGIGTSNPRATTDVVGSRDGNWNAPIAYIENTSAGPGASPALRVVGNGGQANGVLSVSSQGTGLIAQFGNHDNFVVSIANDGTLTVPVLVITGGSDVAEPFKITTKEIPKGSLVVIDENHPGQLQLSDHAYDLRVAGIVSGANGIKPGISLHQEGVLEGGENVALSGRVYALADASNVAIHPGDLLTTSDTPGHCMKVTDHSRAHGAIIGKAMSSLENGRGTVLVLVSLQ